MGTKTAIEWCDSTINPVMGCDGCELWDPERGIRDLLRGPPDGAHTPRRPPKGLARVV
jgi:hypothetical protein